MSVFGNIMSAIVGFAKNVEGKVASAVTGTASGCAGGRRPRRCRTSTSRR